MNSTVVDTLSIFTITGPFIPVFIKEMFRSGFCFGVEAIDRCGNNKSLAKSIITTEANEVGIFLEFWCSIKIEIIRNPVNITVFIRVSVQIVIWNYGFEFHTIGRLESQFTGSGLGEPVIHWQISRVFDVFPGHKEIIFLGIESGNRTWQVKSKRPVTDPVQTVQSPGCNIIRMGCTLICFDAAMVLWSTFSGDGINHTGQSFTVLSSISPGSQREFL